MATIKKAAKKKKAKGELRIRMYRVGFGDMFLMTVPTADGPQHILIDCGVTPGKTKLGDIGTIKDAVAHMAKETGKKLALIIATHRHQDHIIGFSRSAEIFKDFKVGAVWMSFWETEYDPNETKKKSMAAEMQDELATLAMGMQRHLALRGAEEPDADEIAAMLENATGFELAEFAAAGGAGGKPGKGGGTNAASLAFLKNGLGVEPQYYVRGDKPKVPKALAAAGLTAEILGPPPLDAFEFLKLMDLKKGVGQYIGEAGDGSGKKFLPFDGQQGTAQDYTKETFQQFEYIAPGSGIEQMEKLIKQSQPAMLFTAAQTLDRFLNNQSLVVLFTFNGKKLLFAGDAQGGSWEYWMFGGSPEKAPSVDTMEADARALLGNLDFYKVGHHGSTNSTPMAAVDVMGGDFVSMCSTQFGSFGTVENKSEVPRIPLMDALAKKSRIVRSDHFPVTIKGNEVDPVDDAPKKLPTPKRGRFERGSIYIDYFL